MYILYSMKQYQCGPNEQFKDCELAILRNAVDNAKLQESKKNANTPEIVQMISVVESFLKKQKLICYGGTAINNILPKEDRFYNLDVDVPDYDFFSMNALEDAKKLADIYVREGFEEVEAKAGMHFGTYKVFVNFVPVADITQLDKVIFRELLSDCIKVANILYCPPNFLRMSMYLELSRPRGDTSRWEKVFTRLTLLNKHYPLKYDKCSIENFQRSFENTENQQIQHIYDVAKKVFIDQNVVFFGGYASMLYSRYMTENIRKQFSRQPDFDVLSNDPHTTCLILKERLHDEGTKQVKIIKHSSVGEILPEHFEVKVNNETIAFVYKTVACHSYNVISIKKRKIRVATIDTMLSLYLAFIYINNPYYDVDRILCMSQFLFDVQQKNRLRQKGILRRFSINCYGEQKTIEDVRGEKSGKYKELKGRKCKEHEKWFLKYRPYENKGSKRSAKYCNTTKKKSKKENKSGQANKTLKNRIRSLLPI